MDALELLLTRRSTKKLTLPAPEGEALEAILQAGLRAPDHGKLRPYQFIIVSSSRMTYLDEILSHAAEIAQIGDKQKAKIKKIISRTPLIIAVMTGYQMHEKVPLWEQLITAGCAAQAMQMAAFAQGFGGVWVSGEWLSNASAAEALGCLSGNQLVGMLCLGTPKEPPSAPPILSSADFVRYL